MVPYLIFMEDYKNISDEQLMRLIQAGNETAFNEIYQRYSKRLLHFIYRVIGNDVEKAQDLLQDLFVKIASAPEKFNPDKNFKTWVFTVTANLCKNSFRGQQHSFVPLSTIEFANPFALMDSLDKKLFNKELQHYLDQLPPVYKNTFILKYFQGLSLNEIAQIEDCPLGTVKSRLHSALKILSQKLIHHQPY